MGQERVGGDGVWSQNQRKQDASGDQAAEKREVTVPPWSRRFTEAVEQYLLLQTSPAALAEALAKGLRDWASLLPQTDHRTDGQLLPANSWGLAAELKNLEAIIVLLKLHGLTGPAQGLETMAESLRSVSGRLDEHYPPNTADDQLAVDRLVAFARNQADQLATVLLRLCRRLLRLSGPATGERAVSPVAEPLPPASPLTRKRANRARDIEIVKSEVVLHIRDARQHALAARDLGRPLELLPRPKVAELGRRTNLKPWTVYRCLNDPTAHELHLLWNVADDLEQVLQCRN